ncbi:MAG: hypothetical protein CL949_14440 [Erythrobacter sp.]|nr:hypothetical protein [Erythrobacter sp.]
MASLQDHWAASCSWESYPWKNELATQAERVEQHFAEVLDDNFESEWSPLHMLERALVLSAFAMRRMIEKRLVTDELKARTYRFTTYLAANAYRSPAHGSTGGQVFRNYRLGEPTGLRLRIADLANEIIHSSQLLVIYGPGNPSTGLLIASDWNMQKRIIHLTIEEFRDSVDVVLNDRVTHAIDSWDSETNTVRSTRE